MIAGFLGSRVVLSLSMMLFGLNALRGVPPRQWLRQRWWLLGLVWIGFYVVSWFWSDDKAFWNDRVQTKLPFLLLPLAFGLLPAFSLKQLKVFTAGLCLLLVGGIVFSLSFLVRDPSFYIEGYKWSHVIPTPVYRDHIRFSMTIALSIAWCLYIAPEIRRKAFRRLLYICTALFIVYLHLLAAKTGLIAFYLIAVAAMVRLAAGRKWLPALLLAGMMAGGITLAWHSVPTFSQRVGYSIYSYEQYKQGNISGDYSDIGRVVSYELALRLIREHPFTGTGAGDILTAMSAAYDQWHPGIPQAQRLVPHNQFLTIGVATGLVSLACFCWWMAAPLVRLRRDRHSFYFFLTWLLLLFFLMTDASLEVQFGVFVYLFFLLWQRHAFIHRGQDSPVAAGSNYQNNEL